VGVTPGDGHETAESYHPLLTHKTARLQLFLPPHPPLCLALPTQDDKEPPNHGVPAWYPCGVCHSLLLVIGAPGSVMTSRISSLSPPGQLGVHRCQQQGKSYHPLSLCDLATLSISPTHLLTALLSYASSRHSHFSPPFPPSPHTHTHTDAGPLTSTTGMQTGRKDDTWGRMR
jgi:hypothetical protein